MSKEFKPKILAFLCNWCAYAAADSAGVSRLQYPPTTRVIRTMCSARVDPVFVIKGLMSGYDSVFVGGWHIGDCHYQDGNVHTANRMEMVQHLLDVAGIDRERLRLQWVSSAEGPLFARYISEFSEKTKGLGPFDNKGLGLPLAAAKRTLEAPRIRWLIGMTVELTEAGNTYDETLSKEEYNKLLRQAVEDEFQKAIIIEALMDGPLSVQEMAKKIGMSVYSVSLRLNELERSGQAGLSGYDGRTPKFISLAA